MAFDDARTASGSSSYHALYMPALPYACPNMIACCLCMIFASTSCRQPQVYQGTEQGKHKSCRDKGEVLPPRTFPRSLARLALLPPTSPGPKSASCSAHLVVAVGLGIVRGGRAAALLAPFPATAPSTPQKELPSAPIVLLFLSGFCLLMLLTLSAAAVTPLVRQPLYLPR